METRQGDHGRLLSATGPGVIFPHRKVALFISATKEGGIGFLYSGWCQTAVRKAGVTLTSMITE